MERLTKEQYGIAEFHLNELAAFLRKLDWADPGGWVTTYDRYAQVLTHIRAELNQHRVLIGGYLDDPEPGIDWIKEHACGYEPYKPRPSNSEGHDTRKGGTRG